MNDATLRLTPLARKLAEQNAAGVSNPRGWLRVLLALDEHHIVRDPDGDEPPEELAAEDLMSAAVQLSEAEAAGVSHARGWHRLLTSLQAAHCLRYPPGYEEPEAGLGELAGAGDERGWEERNRRGRREVLRALLARGELHPDARPALERELAELETLAAADDQVLAELDAAAKTP